MHGARVIVCMRALIYRVCAARLCMYVCMYVCIYVCMIRIYDKCIYVYIIRIYVSHVQPNRDLYSLHPEQAAQSEQTWRATF